MTCGLAPRLTQLDDPGDLEQTGSHAEQAQSEEVCDEERRHPGEVCRSTDGHTPVRQQQMACQRPQGQSATEGEVHEAPGERHAVEPAQCHETRPLPPPLVRQLHGRCATHHKDLPRYEEDLGRGVHGQDLRQHGHDQVHREVGVQRPVDLVEGMWRIVASAEHTHACDMVRDVDASRNVDRQHRKCRDPEQDHQDDRGAEIARRRPWRGAVPRRHGSCAADVHASPTQPVFESCKGQRPSTSRGCTVMPRGW